MVSRRSFLRTAAVALSGAALAACGATPTATPMPTATKVPPTNTPVPPPPTAVPPTATKPAAAATAAPAAPTAVPPTPVPPTATPIPPTPTVAKATVTGTFQVIQKADFFPAMNDYLKNEMTAYFKANGWNAEITDAAGYTGGTNFLEKLSAAHAANQTPDCMMHTDEITNLQRTAIVTDVSGIVEAVGKTLGNPSARQTFDMTFDKKWFYVPYFQRSDGGWYQEPAFKAKNIDVQKLRLFPELWEACLTVSDPAKQLYGWGVTINRSGDGDWFLYRVFHGWGAYFQDETGNYVTIGGDAWETAVKIATDLYIDKKWANMLAPGILSWGDASNNEAYLAGKLAYTQNGGTVYGKAVQDKNPVAAITRFHPPAGGPVNKEFNSLSANYWAVFSKAKNPAAARQLITDFVGNLDRQDGILSNAPAFALPAYEKLWDLSKYVKTNQVALDQKPVAISPTGNVVAGTYPGPANNPPMAAASTQGVWQDMIAAVLKGTAVKQAVNDCRDRYIKIFKELGKPGTK
jgi:multiple sugar transport system substrate-binding protein